MIKIKTDCLKLSEYRIRQGMKCSDLARKVGVTRQSISAIEQGISPSPNLAKKIVEALGIKFDDVFTIKGN